MLDDHGVARLMDMDVTKRWGTSGPITITSVGQLFGAPEYVSPEHARGVKTDERSDVYSLGCMLYEIFTGHPPYRAATPVATALKHVHEPIPLESAKAARIPEALLPVFRKVLAKNPSRRHPSAKALASALGLARTMSGAPARLVNKTAEKAPLPLLLSALNPVDATIRLNLEDIRSGDPNARRAIPLLIDALDKARGAREHAAEDDSLLQMLGAADVPPPMDFSSLSSRDDGFGSPPILSFVGSPGSIEILVEALKEKDGNVRSKAARALGGIGPAAKEAIPVLLEALRDREAHVRWDAARALGQIGAAAAEGLAAAVNDKDPVVRQIAADALKRIIQRKREAHSAD
ncbi:MAG TPA: HEAT repeat domain-containing protein, partial [Vicinamibacteria bacterium]